MGAGLWVWKRTSLLPLLEDFCLWWEQGCGCEGEYPYFHYWRFSVCDGSRAVGVEEDILNSITGGFLCVMRVGLWVWKSISFLSLLDVFVCDGSRTVGMEEDILTAITGGFVLVIGVRLLVGKTCFYSTSFLYTEASMARKAGNTHPTIMFVVTVRNEVVKVIFLQACVCPGGCVCLSACWDTTP